MMLGLESMMVLCIFRQFRPSIGYLIDSKCCRYRHTSYHKQTKNQWARDDPAFLVVCMYLLVVVATAYCIAYALS